MTPSFSLLKALSYLFISSINKFIMDIEIDDPLKDASIELADCLEGLAKSVEICDQPLQRYLRGQLRYGLTFNSDMPEKFCQLKKALPEFATEMSQKDDQRRLILVNRKGFWKDPSFEEKVQYLADDIDHDESSMSVLGKGKFEDIVKAVNEQYEIRIRKAQQATVSQLNYFDQNNPAFGCAEQKAPVSDPIDPLKRIYGLCFYWNAVPLNYFDNAKAVSAKIATCLKKNGVRLDSVDLFSVTLYANPSKFGTKDVTLFFRTFGKSKFYFKKVVDALAGHFYTPFEPQVARLKKYNWDVVRDNFHDKNSFYVFFTSKLITELALDTTSSSKIYEE